MVTKIKREKAEIKSLIGLDIASKSIEEAQSRYKSSRSPLRYTAEFKTVDCFSNELRQVIKHESYFDAVSVQFAFHYCFESQQKVDNFFTTISKAMKQGAYFYGYYFNRYDTQQCIDCQDARFAWKKVWE